MLIVGAGPAGLTLGNILDKLGVDYLIIDKHPDISFATKATGLHRHSLRLLKQMGLAEDILKESILLNSCNNVKDFRLVNTTKFTQGKNYFDKNISIDQSKLEKILTKKISKRILRSHSLLSYIQCNNGISSEVIFNNKTIVSLFNFT